MLIGVAGLALALIGLAALWYPISLDQYDPYGFPVKCGNGFSSNLTQAVQTNGGDLVTKCDTALLTRRVWAIPAIAIGWLSITAFLFAWVRGAQPAARSSAGASAGAI
jgi:hypothetical protein